MKLGLILGGGGIVGVAWEIGVLAGLQRAIGFDPREAEVIVGTSAGSLVGALAASGRPLDELIAIQKGGAEDQVVRRIPEDGRDRAGGGTSVVPEEIMRLITMGGAYSQERAAAIGKLALEAPIALPAEAYIAYFQALLGTDAWPDTDFRATAVDCATGETVLWGAPDGIGLARAVAASCAVPGHFPVVEFGGRLFTDGPRADFCAALVAERDLDALLFIGPQVLMTNGQGGATLPEIDALAETGLQAVQITGGKALQAFAVDLMDPTARSGAVDIGVKEGRDWAPKVEAMAGGRRTWA